ncbi:zinc finger protein [Phlyctema vagabunda]|uniref:Zinc finger protein n=1 Tax=Phlyctema vagabunda TaxID=108571 RepID=A0ABR4PUA9_9HELO
MAKRSREDFEPSSDSGSDTSGPTARTVIHPTSGEPTSTASKIAHLDISGEAPVASAMKCSLPPHRTPIAFSSFEEYEVHYSKMHTNRCLECRKNFPTDHFLNLHIQENHDALTEVLRERGERTYCCFVDDCERVCSTSQKRRLHLIDKHAFPKEYDFHVVNDGIDGRSSMLRSGRHRRRSSAAQHMTEIEERARRRHSKAMSITATKEDDESSDSEGADPGSIPTSPNSKIDADMDGLTGAMSALKFVPPSIRFGRGRGKGRGGFSRA